jgi:O-antigen/teichoic acid export membrane protein
MKALRNLSIFTFVGFFGAGINFLLMPLLSHYLSPADNGINSILNTYVTLIIPLVGLVAAGLIQVEYYHLEDKREFASLFSSLQIIPIVPTLLLAAVTGLFYPRIAPLLELPPEDLWWALSIFPIAWLSIYIESAVGYQIIQKAAKTYAYFNISRVLVEASLTILFVVILKMGWKGRILSWMLTTFLYSGIAIWYFHGHRLLSWAIKLHYIKRGIIFGAPLILHTLGKFIVNQSDRLFIAKMISVDEAGIYSIGYTLGTVILILSTAFSNMMGPLVMDRLKVFSEKGRLEIVRLSYAGIGVLIAGVALLQIITPFLFKYLIARSYSNGAPYVFWVSLGYFFWGIYLIFVNYIFYYKKNGFLGWMAIVNVVVNIALNLWLIPMMGGLGAALATAISFFIIMVLVVWYATRLVSLPWFEFSRIIGKRKPH